VKATSVGLTIFLCKAAVPTQSFQNKTRKNAIVEYLDYQIPVTQLMGPKGNGDMQTAKRD